MLKSSKLKNENHGRDNKNYIVNKNKNIIKTVERAQLGLSQDNLLS